MCRPSKEHTRSASYLLFYLFVLYAIYTIEGHANFNNKYMVSGNGVPVKKKMKKKLRKENQQFQVMINGNTALGMKEKANQCAF